ncbi:phosphoribosylglycinamide formyltransferase [Lysinibacillus sp. BF-4]|uniref:phosphoribosylglycinamide formyltransferase n=1 Tax=Lysinibacillus sp. BF-4 TaxID=1473546 RepID=UPI000501CD79|nr:phosphoribosylglycinamide formyltransferase [Lysinibacillus sp. BF-4]KFL43071.1 phosphoribosylglycinamide formyltransferase [Lysinibacillus sp. BF-4]
MAPKIAVFASGSGSNFQALYDAIQAGDLQAELVVMVTDQPQAFVVERANKAGVEALTFSPKTFATKAMYEQAVVEALQQRGVEWLVLAGYMRLVSDVLLHAYPNRIVNIHPSLLPSFPGKDAIEQAVAHGVKVTGVTVHYVDEGMDTGPIIAQRAVLVTEGDVEATAQAIHQVEHALYTEALNQILK